MAFLSLSFPSCLWLLPELYREVPEGLGEWRAGTSAEETLAKLSQLPVGLFFHLKGGHNWPCFPAQPSAPPRVPGERV